MIPSFRRDRYVAFPFSPPARRGFSGRGLSAFGLLRPAAAEQGPIGLWTGALVADQGNCPIDTNSTLQIGSQTVSFTPGDNALVLKGTRGADKQHFHAQLDMKDAQRKPYSLVFNGYPVGNAIGGIYGSPTCRAHIVMTRPNH
ncbi:hypothetical protein [Asaia platycodi]|uniref:hypothetical protein n=1 Tax=Asaia platycodi TaxID=610243 RepID=UPI00046E82C5|nr:hypothetical protein [Asaia platycodi]